MSTVYFRLNKTFYLKQNNFFFDSLKIPKKFKFQAALKLTLFLIIETMGKEKYISYWNSFTDNLDGIILS